MKNITKKFKQLSGVLAILLVGLFTNYAIVGAQSPDVVFNNAQGVDIGDERDFLRINDANGGNVAEACEDGQTVQLWFYVHNTNPVELNGADYNGIGVANNTVVDINLPGNESASHIVEGSVTADNAAVSEDEVTIKCDDHEVTLEYVSQSLVQDSNAPADVNYTLTGNILDGAVLGMDGGKVPGCFEYRAYITVTLRVKVEKEEPELKPGVCTLLDVTVLKNRQVRLSKVSFTENDAEADSIAVNFGDGKTENFSEDGSNFPYTHTYTEDGTYEIRATVNMTFDGEERAETSEECTVEITVTTDEPPEQPEPPKTPTPPTELPDTGAGSIAGIMTVVAAAGAYVHRVFTLKRQ